MENVKGVIRHFLAITVSIMALTDEVYVAVLMVHAHLPQDCFVVIMTQIWLPLHLQIFVGMIPLSSHLFGNLAM